MTKNIAFIILLLISKLIFAQGNNEYLFDGSAINPATIVASKSSLSIYYANKLSGINDAPKFQNIKWKNLLGGSNAIALGVNSIKKGVSGVTSYSFSYAFSGRLFAKHKISLGLNSSLNTTYIDETAFIFVDNNDVLFSGKYYSETLPNASAGVYFYNEQFQLGISASNLFKNNIYNRNISKKEPIIYTSFISYNLNLKSFIFSVGNMTLVENEWLLTRVNITGEYNSFIFGSTYDNHQSFGIITGIKFNHMIFHYSYSIPQSINNTMKLGNNEIKITYFLD